MNFTLNVRRMKRSSLAHRRTTVTRQESFLEEGHALQIDIKPHFDRLVVAHDRLTSGPVERSLNNVAVSGGLPAVSAKEMGDGPETRRPLQFQIAAAAIQAERGTLDDGAGPNELFLPPFPVMVHSCPSNDSFSLLKPPASGSRAETEYSKRGSVALFG